MNAAFASWHEFFLMGGYAFYVWLSVSITLLSLLGLVAHTCWQRRRVLAEIRQKQSRDRRIRAAKAKRQTAAGQENQSE